MVWGRKITEAEKGFMLDIWEGCLWSTRVSSKKVLNHRHEEVFGLKNFLFNQFYSENVGGDCLMGL